jgi:hypothetical protein
LVTEAESGIDRGHELGERVATVTHVRFTLRADDDRWVKSGNAA